MEKQKNEQIANYLIWQENKSKIRHLFNSKNNIYFLIDRQSKYNYDEFYQEWASKPTRLDTKNIKYGYIIGYNFNDLSDIIYNCFLYYNEYIIDNIIGYIQNILGFIKSNSYCLAYEQLFYLCEFSKNKRAIYYKEISKND